MPGTGTQSTCFTGTKVLVLTLLPQQKVIARFNELVAPKIGTLRKVCLLVQKYLLYEALRLLV